MQEQIIEFFICLIKNEEKLHLLRSLLINRGVSIHYEIFDLIDVNHSNYIDKNSIINFLKTQKNYDINAKKYQQYIEQFVESYSSTGNQRLTQKDFQHFIFCDHATKKYKEQHQVRYTLYLMILRQLQGIKQQEKLLLKMKNVECDKIFNQISKNKSKITLEDLRNFVKETAALRLNDMEIAHLINRINKSNRQKNSIGIKDFKKIFRKNHIDAEISIELAQPTSNNNNLQYKSKNLLPPSAKQKSQHSLRSTAQRTEQKKKIQNQLEQVSKQIRKKLFVQPKLNYKDILLRKALAFLTMLARKQKQLNNIKQELFRKFKLNLLDLFHHLDKSQCEFITSHQLQEYLGQRAESFVYLYGDKGVIMFWNFIKMLAPFDFTLEEIEQRKFENVTLEIMQHIQNLFAKIKSTENDHHGDLAKIAKQMKLSNLRDILLTVFSNRITLQQLRQQLARHQILVSDTELQLLFYKYDRNNDGYLQLEDFSIYYSK